MEPTHTPIEGTGIYVKAPLASPEFIADVRIPDNIMKLDGKLYRLEPVSDWTAAYVQNSNGFYFTTLDGSVLATPIPESPKEEAAIGASWYEQGEKELREQFVKQAFAIGGTSPSIAASTGESFTTELAKENHIAEEPKRDYTITAVKMKYNSCVYKRDGDEKEFYPVDDDGSTRPIFLDTLSPDKDFEIYSVKNKANNEITTGGWYKIRYSEETKKIESFYLKGDKIFARTTGTTFGINIDQITPSAVIFTTNDDVPIYDNNTTYFVVTSEWELGTIHGGNPIRELSDGRWLKTFSTKEKAEAYILLHKPCLSLEEIHTAMYLYSMSAEQRRALDDLYEYLERQVKAKQSSTYNQ